MTLHDALHRWQDTAFKSVDDLYRALDEVAALVAVELPQGGHWRQIAIYFVTLNSGIRQKAGVHPIYFEGPARQLERALDGV